VLFDFMAASTESDSMTMADSRLDGTGQR